MLKYIGPVTPAVMSTEIAALCADLSAGVTPIYIDVKANAGEPINECFEVVQRYVDEFGGSTVLGWIISELPTVFIEAEFHAVWQMPQGDLLDVSPKVIPSAKILFLQDPVRVYEGIPLNNARRALSSNPVVRDFLDAHDALHTLLIRGDRGRKRGAVQLHGDEAVEFEKIQALIADLGLQVEVLYPEVSPYLPCLCGSGRKSKWCHGVSFEPQAVASSGRAEQVDSVRDDSIRAQVNQAMCRPFVVHGIA